MSSYTHSRWRWATLHTLTSPMVWHISKRSACWIANICGNRRIQTLRSSMGKPLCERTTFVITYPSGPQEDRRQLTFLCHLTWEGCNGQCWGGGLYQAQCIPNCDVVHGSSHQNWTVCRVRQVSGKENHYPHRCEEEKAALRCAQHACNTLHLYIRRAMVSSRIPTLSALLARKSISSLQYKSSSAIHSSMTSSSRERQPHSVPCPPLTPALSLLIQRGKWYAIHWKETSH